MVMPLVKGRSARGRSGSVRGGSQDGRGQANFGSDRNRHICLRQTELGHLAQVDHMLFQRRDRNVTSKRAAGVREKDPRLGSRYGWRFKASGWSVEETLVQGRETKEKTRFHPTSHQGSCQSPQHQQLAMRQLWCCANGHCAIYHAGHQIARFADAVCLKSGSCVTSSIAIGL